MLHPIWINIGLIINMFKHFLMYISWWEDLCLFYDDKIFRAQGILLCCHHSVHWALFTLPERASLSPLSTAQTEMVPAPFAEGLFMGSEDIWNMCWDLKARIAAWLEGQCPLSAPNSHRGRWESDLERLGTDSASKAVQIPGKHAQKWGRKERDSAWHWEGFKEPMVLAT